MQGNRGNRRRSGATGWGVSLAALLLSGCSIAPGNPFGFASQNHRLLDTAEAMRQAAPEPLPLPRELDKQVLASYIVEPGDVLLVQPIDLDSSVRLPGDQPVLPDGTINLGRYGRPIVAGRTLEEIEAIVRAAVEAHTRDAGFISVRLVARQSKVYYVIGEVNAPGAFQLQGRETVLDAIMAAGGVTDRASGSRMILARPTPPPGCRIVLPICYWEIVQLGDTSTNYQIAPGDRVYVPSKTLCEQIFPKKLRRSCPPCGMPQVPCAATGLCGGDHGLPRLFHELPPAPGAAPALPAVPPANLSAPRRLEGDPTTDRK